MTEERDQEVREPDGPPEAVVQTRSGFSFVWLIPIVASLVGAWLAFQAFSQRGPTVIVTFKTGEGLEAGKTKVKYRDIQVGTVDSVTLAEDLSHVLVKAELERGGERYLTENTRFWVVRARVSAGQVSGIGTVFSGAYIGMDPSTDGERQQHFTGLEVAPVMTTDEPGHQFTLRSEGVSPVEVGSPVYYRSIRVGQVLSYELDESGEFVTTEIFVQAPHHERVSRNTRFWDASGLDLSLDAEGIRLDSPSFVAMLMGGVAFDTPGSLAPGGAVEEDHVFTLYRNREATTEKSYALKRRYLLHFDGSVQGLAPGAPVVFRGIKIGEVVDLSLQFDHEAMGFRIPVLIETEPERIAETGVEITDTRQQLVRLVEQGLRAQLASGNLLTGQLQVELDMHPDAPPAQVLFDGPYPELPTVPTPFDEITAGLTRIVDRLSKVPLEEIGGDLRQVMQSLRATLDETRGVAKQLNQDLAPTLAAALTELEGAVESANKLLSPSSPTRRELQRALTELAGAARSARLLADYLEQHPEALIRGKEEQ
jgi:paraquat-inducible protein B